MNNFKYKNKYRIPTTRLKNYNYSSDGAYFITICTKNKQHYFGEIVDGVLVETEQSKICRECWGDLANHYDNCILDEFVIMPNHIHGIIIIQNDDDYNDVETIHELSLQNKWNNRDICRKMLIPKIVGKFKMQTAKKINLYQQTLGTTFWQSRFYDRIIRNEKELFNIRQYILNNPIKWQYDEYYQIQG